MIKKSKVLCYSIVLFLVPVLFIFLYNAFLKPVNMINQTAFNDEGNTLIFDLIYTAPHSADVITLTYDGNTNTFTESKGYLHGMYGFINKMELKQEFDIDLNELIAEYGQSSFMKTINDIIFVTFDGWRLVEFKDELKPYTVLKITESGIEHISTPVKNNFYANDLIYYNENYYLLGGEINPNTSIFSMILYNIHTGEEIIAIPQMKFTESNKITFFDKYIAAADFDIENGRYSFIVYDIETDEIVQNFSLFDYQHEDARSQGYIEVVDDFIFYIYDSKRSRIEDKGNFGIIKMNKSFEVVDVTKFSTDGYYDLIVKTVTHNGKIYILTDFIIDWDGLSRGILYEYNHYTNETSIVLDFERTHKPVILFLSDMFLLE